MKTLHRFAKENLTKKEYTEFKRIPVRAFFNDVLSKDYSNVDFRQTLIISFNWDYDNKSYDYWHCIALKLYKRGI